MPKKPMLADNKPWNEEKVSSKLPLWGSPKLDGIRMLVDGGVGYSRSLKPLPNLDLQRKVRANAAVLQGFDGEIIIGDPAADDCYSKTFTAVMGENGVHDHVFMVFDRWDLEATYTGRYSSLAETDLSANAVHEGFLVEVLEQQQLDSMEELRAFAAHNFEAGFEGSIFRDPHTTYKHGRSTTNEGKLYKMKKWVDTEVTIVGFEELLHNNNAAYTNETGRTQRSSHKANKVGGDTLGAFICRGVFPDGTAYTTRVGTFKGITKPELKEIWDTRQEHLGMMIKIKYMDVGIKDAPRHPVFLGFRSPIDL